MYSCLKELLNWGNWRMKSLPKLLTFGCEFHLFSIELYIAPNGKTNDLSLVGTELVEIFLLLKRWIKIMNDKNCNQQNIKPNY